MEDRNRELFSRFEGRKAELIPLLQTVQEEYGYLSSEAIKDIAEFIGEPECSVYGVATFYAQFRFSPIGRALIRRLLFCFASR